MDYVSLYRRFRPDTFDKVIGQAHIVKTLTNQIASGRISHAYLFTGTRGTGKTTCAKIFARAVNCLNPINGSPCGKCEICKQLSNPNNMIDVIEMDAASNNGVGEIRELKESVQYRSDYCKYKVYIIDEVHMLSGSAFNALLKTLEEPPSHVIFILATTEVQKLPQTILSRCMRFDFRLVAIDQLVALLEKIFGELKVTYDIEALTQIAIHGEGSVRDTLSLADMVLSYCGKHISYADTLEVLCANDFETLNELGNAILSSDVANALRITEESLKNGRNTIAKDLANYFVDVLEIKNAETKELERISANQRESLKATANKFSNYRLARVMDIMANMENTLRFASQPRIVLESNIVRACELVTETNLEGLTNRIKELETKLKGIEQNGVCVIDNNAIAPEVVAKATKANKVKKETKKVISKQPEFVSDPDFDANKILSENSLQIEEVEVFDKVEDIQDNSNHELQILLEKIKGKLIESDESFMETILSDIDIDCYNLEGNKIIVDADASIKSFFNMPGKLEFLKQIVKDALGEDFDIFFKEQAEVKKLKEDDRIMLADLFGNKIKYT